MDKSRVSCFFLTHGRGITGVMVHLSMTNCCLFIVCLSCLFSHYARQYLLKMGGQLDKRMLHWQPAKCYIFQLFIIICYLANKLLLLLLLLLQKTKSLSFGLEPPVDRSE